MALATPRQAASEGRRREILAAALACFLERGVAAATIEEIRDRSGASVGSIYHHFGGKQELAAAVYLEGIRDYQEGFRRELRRHRDAESGIKGIVRYHLRWIAAHPDWARYLLHHREPEVLRASEGALEEMNRRLFAEVAAWAEERGGAGVVGLPPDLANAMWLGPAQEFARHWLAGRAQTSIERAARVLAEAAWRSLRTVAGSQRTRRRGG